MIAEFLERKTTVTLITRPRRFHRNIADTFGIRQRRASSGEDNQYEQALPTHGMLSDFFDVTKNSASIFEASAI